MPGVPEPESFKSSTLTDYEVGLKTTFLDGRAQANISAFHIDWKDIQVATVFPSCGCGGIANGPKARSDGFDLSASYSPIDGLVLGGNLSYADAVATAPIADLDTAKGARLPNVPLWSGSITATYTAPISESWNFEVGGGYRYGGTDWSQVEGASSGGIPASS